MIIQNGKDIYLITDEIDSNQRKVSPAVHLEFFTKYYARAYPKERFGQAFLNHVLPGVVCPELFYQKNDSLADAYIWEHFLELED